jgi:6-phosphogluconate dehydrogenase
MTEDFDIGLIGLGVMGSNLAINLHRNGYRVIGFDINPKNLEHHPFETTDTLDVLFSNLKNPPIVLLMVPAGDPVDSAIHSFAFLFYWFASNLALLPMVIN